ncbi:hypothetical protein E2C01_015578 [Portunus trituberculatus]|uniref:Uncharacterized protein n=1 Tax=Portunus trituberculatus TaxID=210409 RepID=A0A5B7DLX6_PORTR|nr:hypothetical protein [Portunus trituberculatus]
MFTSHQAGHPEPPTLSHFARERALHADSHCPQLTGGEGQQERGGVEESRQGIEARNVEWMRRGCGKMKVEC